MSEAILSYLGGWWARWFGRAAEDHRPMPAPAPVREPEPVAVPMVIPFAEAVPEAVIAPAEPESADESEAATCCCELLLAVASAAGLDAAPPAAKCRETTVIRAQNMRRAYVPAPGRNCFA